MVVGMTCDPLEEGTQKEYKCKNSEKHCVYNYLLLKY